MGEEPHRNPARSQPRPTEAVQRAFVTHGKRAPMPVVREGAARVIPRTALLEGNEVPNLRRGGMVRGPRVGQSFEGWTPSFESPAGFVA